MTVKAETETLTLRSRLDDVLSRIEDAARRAGRDPSDVTLVAVSKTHTVERVHEAATAGISDFGENKVQEAEGKITSIAREGIRWHLIGHLQSNKARRAVRLFDLIHTIDSAPLVERLERICAEQQRARLEVLVQVDLAGEAAKSGVSIEELPSVFAALERCERVRCRGLMALPPFEEDAERIRPYFSSLRRLRDTWRARGYFGESEGELSMGMSHDFEAAIEEGATIVRVGTALFGARESN